MFVFLYLIQSSIIVRSVALDGHLLLRALMMNESIDQKHEINSFILHLFLEIVKQGIDNMPKPVI